MGSDSRRGNNPLLELDEPGAPSSRDVNVEDVAPSGTSLTVRPPGEASEIRERYPTITDEDALEAARLQSLPSQMPPARAPYSTRPGPIIVDGQDTGVEVDAGESDLDALGPDEQVAILRANLSPLTRVPALARPLAELGEVLADPKTAFVLGFVDGILPLETILDVTGLPELDTLKVLDRMLGHGLIVFVTSKPPRAI